MIPTLNGKTHHFVMVGIYDGLFVMKDSESNSLWNHITGEAMYGAFLGTTLPVSNLLQMNVKQGLAMDPNMAVAISPQPFLGDGQRRRVENPDAGLQSKFVATLGAEDTRRPRMDLGLGVWSGDTHRYYPLESMRRRGGAFVDVINNQRIVIYVDPETATPAAIFADAKEATWQEKEILLGNGTVVRSGMLFGPDGKSLPTSRPQQLFSRWYGFSLTFPGCELFDE